uniref:Uncharacterized protein n=1 Tax=Arundo donax TaxID=35708 RepID=A0A0A9AK87_ARUDO
MWSARFTLPDPGGKLEIDSFVVVSKEVYLNLVSSLFS